MEPGGGKAGPMLSPLQGDMQFGQLVKGRTASLDFL
jgi:hypothetical protein